MWGVAELLIYNTSYFWVFLNAGAGSYTACTIWTTIYTACTILATIYTACTIWATIYTACTIWATIYTACTIWATIYMACNYSVLAKHSDWKHGITVRPRFNAAPI